MLKKTFWALIALCSWSTGLLAQPAELDSSLHESVMMIPKKIMLGTIELETTVYKPDGNGPFPIAIINHGKASGNPLFQGRYRPASAARYFLQRGYVVVVPMRQGFSKSGGSYNGVGCNVESNGEVQAEDVKAVLDHVGSQPWADKENIVVAGQSHGGWTTLAFGTLNYPGVKALINFAGGLRQESCTSWQAGLARGAGSFGKTTKTPSLWFYGDNDSYFDVSTYRAMFENYRAAGAQARLIEFGTFGSDAHSMFGSTAGEKIWHTEVSQFLKATGLPNVQQTVYTKQGVAPLTPIPPATQFAPLNDETKIPYLKDAGRNGYKTYLSKSAPKAFAIAPTGAWAWAEGGDDPLKRALESCSKFAKQECRLYSVNDTVVWNAQ